MGGRPSKKIVAALLARRWGQLSDEEYNCEACIRHHEQVKALNPNVQTLRERRGCGTPPMMPNGKLWEAEKWYSEGTPADSPRSPYVPGNTGNVGRTMGFLWPWCPKWFTAFVDAEEYANAVEVIDLVDWLESGALHLRISGVLSAGWAEIVDDARRHNESLRADFQEKEAKRLREQSGH